MVTDENPPFRQVGDLLTVQQSRFQVGFSDVLSVVGVNLRDTRRHNKRITNFHKSFNHQRQTIVNRRAVLTNRSASSQHAPVTRAKMASSQSCWCDTFQVNKELL